MVHNRLSNEALHDLMQGFIAYANNIYNVYGYFAQSLFSTGLRFSELKNNHLWVPGSEDNFLVPTLKGGLVRNIKFTELPDFAVSDVLGGNYIFNKVSNATICRFFLAYSPYGFIRIGTNTSAMHLYRHNKIKQLHDAGMSVSDISVYIGEKSDLNTIGYINSFIYY